MASDSDSGRSKPMPVRAALPGKGARGEVTFPGRSFQDAEGREWWAQELGWTRSGRREDAGAVLLLLGFRPVEEEADRDPSVDGFELEVLVPERSVEGLSVPRLREALKNADPHERLPEPSSFFGGTARRKRDGQGRRGSGRSRS